MKKIIHLDCDCFYAAIEMRDDPTLAQLPVAVGGGSDRRGVICTSNYVARSFGVKSAMATAHAKRLCPELVVIPPNFEKYKVASQQIQGIFKDYTSLIQPLSLDEAFLDVTDSDHCQGSATWIAGEIKQKVLEQIGISISAGVAPNKFIAKVASDWDKPNGLKVVPPEAVDDFVKTLPVEKLFGVGKVTAEKLHRASIYTCEDIRRYPVADFHKKFGQFGSHLWELAHGRDERPVRVNSTRKSLSVEHTYPRDLPNLQACYQALPKLLGNLKRRLDKSQSKHFYKSFLKIKFKDFSATTAETIALELQDGTFKKLCKQAFERKGQPVRLLGVGVRFQQSNNAPNQLQLEF